MKAISTMLNSENPKTLGEFYTKVLGKPHWQDGDWYGFFVDGGGLMIGPHSEVKGKNAEPQRYIVNFTTEDVKGEFERISAFGAKTIAEPYQPDKEKSGNVWLATLEDPDGNFFQLNSPWED